MKFDLIIRKIFKFIATKCQILRLKSKFNFGRGSAPGIDRGAYSAAPDLVTEFSGPTSKGLEEMGREMGVWQGRRMEGRGGPQGLVHTPMSEILKNTLIAELI